MDWRRPVAKSPPLPRRRRRRHFRFQRGRRLQSVLFLLSSSSKLVQVSKVTWQFEIERGFAKNLVAPTPVKVRKTRIAQ